MTILNREQIDATYPGPLRDTAFAYHDLRDAVLALWESDPTWGDDDWLQVGQVREVVARVERGES